MKKLKKGAKELIVRIVAVLLILGMLIPLFYSIFI